MALFCSSCVNFKNLIYLNETSVESLGKSYIDQDTFENEPLRDYRVKANDNLYIRINNFEGNTIQFLNEEVSAGQAFAGSGQGINANIYLNSYTVSKAGTIQLPLVGSLKVEGKTTLEIKTQLDKLLEPHLKLPSTSVKLANFRVTILGEVNDPGLHYIYNDYGTIMEVLGLAGDLTEFANRKNIKVIRETESGLQTARINLTRPDLLTSPYYYVRPNDVIYVEPVKARAFKINASTASIAISAVSVATLIANVLINVPNN